MYGVHNNLSVYNKNQFNLGKLSLCVNLLTLKRRIMFMLAGIRLFSGMEINDCALGLVFAITIAAERVGLNLTFSYPGIVPFYCTKHVFSKL